MKNLQELRKAILDGQTSLYDYIATNYRNMDKEELKEWALNILYEATSGRDKINYRLLQLSVIDDQIEGNE